MDNQNIRKLFIIRRESLGIGGAEKVANRFIHSFSEHFDTELIHAGKMINGFRIGGSVGPSWFKCFRFATSARSFLAKHPSALVLSMERGVPGTIYRAGDGVHLAWQKYKYSNALKKISNPMNFILPWLEKISVENSKFVVANSKLIKKHLHIHYPKIQPNKVSVIYNGYDGAVFRHLKEEGKSELRQKWRISKDNLNLLFSGSGWSRKGLDLVFNIASRLSQQGLALKVWVAGRGNQEKYKSLALKLGITTEVEFLGPLENIQELYQTCDYMILPTKYDAFSNSCLEALSCGCRVVTTIQNGASELINESNGLVLNYTDSDYCKKVAKHLASFANNKPTFDSRNFENVYGEEREIKEYFEVLNSA